MRTIAMEPGFSKRSTRAFVCAGMAGELVLHEKGWLGHKQTILDQGEGPIWQARWEGRIIAWANDVVRISFLEREIVTLLTSRISASRYMTQYLRNASPPLLARKTAQERTSFDVISVGKIPQH